MLQILGGAYLLDDLQLLCLLPLVCVLLGGLHLDSHDLAGRLVQAGVHLKLSVSAVSDEWMGGYITSAYDDQT